eukprot:390605-Hanusia_phi.AAC.2
MNRVRSADRTRNRRSDVPKARTPLPVEKGRPGVTRESAAAAAPAPARPRRSSEGADHNDPPGGLGGPGPYGAPAGAGGRAGP